MNKKIAASSILLLYEKKSLYVLLCLKTATKNLNPGTYFYFFLFLSASFQFFWIGQEKQGKNKLRPKTTLFGNFCDFLLTFLNFSELRSSCPESDFLLGLLFPDEDIIGCRRFQSLDEFTTSLASCKKSWKVIETLRFA